MTSVGPLQAAGTVSHLELAAVEAGVAAGQRGVDGDAVHQRREVRPVATLERAEQLSACWQQAQAYGLEEHR